MICQKDGRNLQRFGGHEPVNPHLCSHLLLLVTIIWRPTLARDGEKEGNAEQEEAQLPAVLLARCARGRRPVAENYKSRIFRFHFAFPTPRPMP